MTTSPPAVEPPDEPEHDQQPEPQQPQLHVVRAGEPAPAVESEPDSTEVDDGIAPDAPWQYKLGAFVASISDQLPAAWGQRPASFAERVQYSLEGDWTAAEPGQSAKRLAHLIGMFACLAVDGLLVTPLRFATDKPSRLGVLALAALLVAYIL